jgi:hypothetical protein
MFPLILLQAKAVSYGSEPSYILQLLKVSINSPSGEGGEWFTLGGYMAGIVSINSPSGEGGEGALGSGDKK